MESIVFRQNARFLSNSLIKFCAYGGFRNTIALLYSVQFQFRFRFRFTVKLDNILQSFDLFFSFVSESTNLHDGMLSRDVALNDLNDGTLSRDVALNDLNDGMLSRDVVLNDLNDGMLSRDVDLNDLNDGTLSRDVALNDLNDGMFFLRILVQGR